MNDDDKKEFDHAEAHTLLPWFINQTVDNDEARAVQHHVQSCPQCQAEVRQQQRLAKADADAPQKAAPDIAQALSRMQLRLDAHIASAAPGFFASCKTEPSGSMDETARPSPVRQCAQDALDHDHAGRWQSQALPHCWQAASPPQRYHALSAESAVEANIVVVFRPDATVDTVQRILHAADARIVGGPTVTNSYLLDIKEAQVPAALQRLRSEQAIELAEALNAGGRQ